VAEVQIFEIDKRLQVLNFGDAIALRGKNMTRKWVTGEIGLPPTLDAREVDCAHLQTEDAQLNERRKPLNGRNLIFT
jgi:hypothetical protein